MSAQTIDRQTTATTSSTPKGSDSNFSLLGALGALMGVAVVLVGAGAATSTAAIVVVGVVLGVAAAFIVASREMGDRKVS